MIEKKIYSSVDPEGNLIGTYGYFGDALEQLESRHNSHNPEELKKLVEIRPRCEPFRYRRGTPLGTSYALYVPVCVEANKTAYIAWTEGKKVYSLKTGNKDTYTKGERIEPDFLNDVILIAEEEKVVEREYAPFKTIDEFIEASGVRVKPNEKGNRPFIWLHNSAAECDSLITEYKSDCNKVFISDMTLDMVELFRNWTFLDGSPCGKEKGK